MNPGSPLEPDLREKRSRLFASLRERGMTNTHVLDAMRAVPREAFVDAAIKHLAYDDNALPIAFGQTVSQPTVVAMMTTALRVESTSSVLEVGAGSGYQAAVLSHLARKVVSIERHQVLAGRAREVLRNLDINNVVIYSGDGSLGWPADAPYDRMLITAAAPSIPYGLLGQLRDVDGSRLVVPVGNQELQNMIVVERSGDEWVETTIGQVRFVPLRGQAGWPTSEWSDAPRPRMDNE